MALQYAATLARRSSANVDRFRCAFYVAMILYRACSRSTLSEKSSAEVESIEVESSHCGMGHHPAVVYAVADRLAQPEGQWKPFDRSGWRAVVYPDPNR